MEEEGGDDDSDDSDEEDSDGDVRRRQLEEAATLRLLRCGAGVIPRGGSARPDESIRAP